MKPKTFAAPTQDDVRKFLLCVDADHLAAKTSKFSGMRMQEDEDASSRVYRWLKHFADNGDFPPNLG